MKLSVLQWALPVITFPRNLLAWMEFSPRAVSRSHWSAYRSLRTWTRASFSHASPSVPVSPPSSASDSGSQPVFAPRVPVPRLYHCCSTSSSALWSLWYSRLCCASDDSKWRFGLSAERHAASVPFSPSAHLGQRRPFGRIWVQWTSSGISCFISCQDSRVVQDSGNYGSF
jgi:hypothetical protein